MRSLIAALRTLVLPFGQRTGRRIVLDGVNGRIDIYGAAGQLVSRVDGDGYHLYAPGGTEIGLLDALGLVVRHATNGSSVRMVTDTLRAALEVDPPDVPGAAYGPGALSASSVAATKAAASVLESPQIGGGNRSSIVLYGGNPYTGDLSIILIDAEDEVSISAPAVRVTSILDIDDIRYHKGYSAIQSVTVTAAATHVESITFTVPFTSLPRVFVNINGSAGAYARWGARAINVTVNGFDIFLFSVNPAGAAASFTVDVAWTAIYPG